VHRLFYYPLADRYQVKRSGMQRGVRFRSSLILEILPIGEVFWDSNINVRAEPSRLFCPAAVAALRLCTAYWGAQVPLHSHRLKLLHDAWLSKAH
jgi:hypothetical protein